MRKCLFLYLLIVMLCKCSCDDDHWSIDIYNNSEKTIFTNNGWHYPDTTFAVNYVFDPFYNDKKDTANKTQWAKPFQKCITYVGRHSTWESNFKYENDTVMIFIFDGDVIGNVDWEIVKKDYLILQRYDLSLQDLQKLNWKVDYPPTEAMKEMKMYPSYQGEQNDDTD